MRIPIRMSINRLQWLHAGRWIENPAWVHGLLNRVKLLWGHHVWLWFTLESKDICILCSWNWFKLLDHTLLLWLTWSWYTISNCIGVNEWSPSHLWMECLNWEINLRIRHHTLQVRLLFILDLNCLPFSLCLHLLLFLPKSTLPLFQCCQQGFLFGRSVRHVLEIRFPILFDHFGGYHA